MITKDIDIDTFSTYFTHVWYNFRVEIYNIQERRSADEFRYRSFYSHNNSRDFSRANHTIDKSNLMLNACNTVMLLL